MIVPTVRIVSQLLGWFVPTVGTVHPNSLLGMDRPKSWDDSDGSFGMVVPTVGMGSSQRLGCVRPNGWDGPSQQETLGTNIFAYPNLEILSWDAGPNCVLTLVS